MKEMEDLLEALRVIRYICEQNKDCCHCPLRDADETCTLGKELPVCWELVDEVPKVRLFKDIEEA